MKNESAIVWIAFVFLFIGGLNMGFIGAFGFDVLHSLFGHMMFLLRVIYALIGLSALYFAYWAFNKCKNWE